MARQRNTIGRTWSPRPASSVQPWLAPPRNQNWVAARITFS